MKQFEEETEEKFLPKKSGTPGHSTTASKAAIIYTACLVVEWFLLGLNMEIVGPTLPFLQKRANSDLAGVTQSLSGKSIGLLLGATLGGLTVDRLRGISNLVLGICITISAVGIVAVPYASHIAVYWAAFAVTGLMEGIINVVGQDALLRLWKDKAAGPLHLLHLGFGSGACVIPLVVSLFFATDPALGGRPSAAIEKCDGNMSAAVLSEMFVTDTPVNTTLDNIVEPNLIEGESHQQYAYVLLASLGAAYSLVFFFLHFGTKRTPAKMIPVEPKKSIRETLYLSSCLPGSKVKAVVMLCLLATFFANLGACDRVFGSFIFIYTQSELCFSTSEAVQINSAFWGVFTAARLAAFFLSRWLLPRYLLFIEVVGYVVCCVILAIFGSSSGLVTWIFFLTAALFMGPMFPSGMAWANRYLDVTGMVITIIIFGLSAGIIACQMLVGYFYEYYGARVLMYFAAGFSILLLLQAIILQSVACTIGDRFEQKQEKEKSLASEDIKSSEQSNTDRDD